MRRALPENSLTRSRGVATLELSLLVPILFVFCLGLVQLIIYLQSSTVTQYAGFVAARSFQVYGDATLKDIHYRRTRALPYTNPDQTIAEAAAEKVIFESLLWEQRRIAVDGDRHSLDRYYEDGNHALYRGVKNFSNPGTVHVDFKACDKGSGCPNGSGVEVYYCLPIVFPGVNKLFESSKKKWPCTGSSLGREYKGIAISAFTPLKRERLEP